MGDRLTQYGQKGLPNMGEPIPKTTLKTSTKTILNKKSVSKEYIIPKDLSTFNPLLTYVYHKLNIPTKLTQKQYIHLNKNLLPALAHLTRYEQLFCIWYLSKWVISTKFGRQYFLTAYGLPKADTFKRNVEEKALLECRFSMYSDGDMEQRRPYIDFKDHCKRKMLPPTIRPKEYMRKINKLLEGK